VLNLASNSPYDFSGSRSSSNARIDSASISAWFNLDLSATGAVSDCGVTTYELFESDKTTGVAETTAFIDNLTKEIVIVQST